MDNKEIASQLPAALKALSFFRSVILSGGVWTDSCDQARDSAVRAITQAIHSQQFQSAGGHWVPFAERWPNQSPALDNPDVKATDTVLVTNNINARDRMGRMSHVWYAAPIESSNGGVVAYDNGDRKIEGLTHWFDPLAATQPKEVELVSRDERAKARNALLDLIIRVYRHGRTSECCTREEAIDAVNTLTLAATHSLQSQPAVRVCSLGDTVCGDNPKNWCSQCPLHVQWITPMQFQEAEPVERTTRGGNCSCDSLPSLCPLHSLPHPDKIQDDQPPKAQTIVPAAKVLVGNYEKEIIPLVNWDHLPEGAELYLHPAKAQVPEGWQVHAKVNAPADIPGQRIVGYRVTIPEGGWSGALDWLPSLATTEGA